MATELLAVPEEHLEEVIKIIRAGMENVTSISFAVKGALTEWCDDEEHYLKRLQEEG